MNRYRWTLMCLTVAALLLGIDLGEHGFERGIAYFALDIAVLALVAFALFSNVIPVVKSKIKEIIDAH